MRTHVLVRCLLMFVAVISLIGSASIAIGQSLTRTTDISTFQSYLLSFLGQQAIAHAAEIFATLTAAFAFATGFKHKKTDTGTQLYVLILTVLFTWSIFAFFRAYYYGVFSNTVLHGSPNPSAIGNLTAYWSFVACTATRSNPLLGFAGIGGTIESLSLSWALGSIIAVAIVTYLPSETTSSRDGSQKLDYTFRGLHPLYRAAFWLALVGYWTDVSVVPYRGSAIAIILSILVGIPLAYAIIVTFKIPLLSLRLQKIPTVCRYWNWHWSEKVLVGFICLTFGGLGIHYVVVLLVYPLGIC